MKFPKFYVQDDPPAACRIDEVPDGAMEDVLNSLRKVWPDLREVDRDEFERMQTVVNVEDV